MRRYSSLPLCLGIVGAIASPIVARTTAPVPTPHATATPVSSPSKSAAQDEAVRQYRLSAKDDIDEAVVRHMWDDTFGNNFFPHHVSPLFLKLDGNDPSADFLRRFPGKIGPFHPVSDCTTSLRGVIDRKTGAHGAKLYVGPIFWMSDHEVRVSGGYFANGLNAATAKYFVLKKDDHWRVVKRMLTGVS